MDEMTVSTTSPDERNFAMLAHLLGIFTGPLGALIIWLIKRGESTYAEQEAREALNFQITLLIGYCIAGLMVIVLIGLALLPLLHVINIIFCIIAAIASSKGQGYRYPFALRLVS
ncbi:MAG: DUF4870 domain-containing protein [Burkholderiaceae bacterium]|nr:DUF4870 domain-containing protein [Burkholderiaceae bacterium]